MDPLPIPNKPCGRDREIAALLESRERVSHDSLAPQPKRGEATDARASAQRLRPL